MRTIHKHVISPDAFGYSQSFGIQHGAKFLSAGGQRGNVALWFEVETSNSGGSREFQVVPTGGEVPPYGEYRATVLFAAGEFVVHLYEILR